MAFKDYFNDNNDDDDEEFEEEGVPDREIKVGDKTYKSVYDLTENASFEELEEALIDSDKKLDEYDEIIKKTEKGYKICRALTLIGAGLGVLSFLSLGQLGIIKNVIDVLSCVAFGVGITGVLFNKIQYKAIGEKYNNEIEISELIDVELEARENEYNLNEKAKEIFADVFSEV